MIAKFKGTCAVCRKPVNVGDEIGWSRRERGRVYHAACIERETPASPSAPVASPAPVLDPEQLLQALASLLKNSAVVSTVESSVECEPAESDYDSTVESKPAPAAKTTVVSKHRKLDTNAAWYEVLSAILPVSNRVLLVGPPSSGKSTTAMLSAETKHRLTMTETTSREDLIGMFHLIDGETRWIDGPVTVAMRNGDAVLIDEIDRYSPECASLLYSLIDDKPHVSLPTGEFVEASDGYKVIMTTNESVETLPVAVQDRIEVIIVASTPHEAAIADMPDAGRDVCMRYYKVQPVRALKLAPTVRRMRTFYRLLKNGIPNEVAANLVFGAQGAQEVLSALTSAEGN